MQAFFCSLKPGNLEAGVLRFNRPLHHPENNMPTPLEVLLSDMKLLENAIIDEIQKQQTEFSYEIRKHRINFDKKSIEQHQKYTKKIIQYVLNTPAKIFISMPFIWSCLVPILLLDLITSLYQFICFPIFGIPRVKHQDYIVFDRQYLGYLNFIEKMNCAYCSYANGSIAYVQEIAARTEQFWCPIKHARHIKNLHSRYYKFLSYGDAESYQKHIETIRHDFHDLSE